MQNFHAADACLGARLKHIVALAVILLGASSFIEAHPSQAKTPGSTYCFYKTCHRVKTITETRALVGLDHTLPASFYDDCKHDRYNPCGLTSSGEVFRANEPDNAASPIYPDGTKLLVWSPGSGQALVLRINNAGPYWGNRLLDVSRAAAHKLGFGDRGVASLNARVLEAPTKADATYRRNRSYERVEGDIGHFASLSAAHAAITSIQLASAAVLAPFNGRSLPAGIVNDDTTTSQPISVAAFIPAAKPAMKLFAEALADASQLVRWPVVHQPAAHDGGKKLIASANDGDDDAPAKLKRGESYSQRVTKDKSSANGSPRHAQASAGRRIEQAKTPVARQANIRVADLRRTTGVGGVKHIAAARKDVAVAQVVRPLPRREHDAPHDISMFSRYNPEAPQNRQTAIRSGSLLRTSSVAIRPAGA